MTKQDNLLQECYRSYKNVNIEDQVLYIKKTSTMEEFEERDLNIRGDYYILASPDYVLASPGNTYSSSSNNSFGLVPEASPTLSLFHDDPYMKVMQAYYAKELPIPPPTIVPPSSMLSAMINPQEFFLPEELLSLKKRGRDQSSSSTSALPQAFEIG
ncbi:hypothetical protein Tco_0127020 [Tanacetum coccineum]